MLRPPLDRSKPENRATGSRAESLLNGWKEIGSYLGKAERTVKRWEVDRGLPIYRAPGNGRGAVFAYRDELSAWLQSSSASVLELADDRDGTSSANVGEHARTVEALPMNASLPHDALPVLDSRALLPASAGLGPLGASWEATSPPQQNRTRSVSRWFLLAAMLLVAGAALLTASRGNRSTAHGKPAESTGVSTADQLLAHDLYLKGRFEWNRRTPESLERALDDFTEAIVHDPESARAYAGLSDTYVLMHEYSSLRTRDSYTRAIAAAKKAVQLDDALAEAHRSLAFAEVWGTWDYVDSDKQFRRAIALDPKDPLTHLWYATAFEGMPGWRAVVLREFNRAQELDPSSPVILSNKGIWLFGLGETKVGFDLVQQVERNNPDFVAPHHYLAMMYWVMRDYPNFLAENQRAASLKHDEILSEITQAALSGFRRDGERGLVESIYVARKKFDLKGDEEAPSLAEICLRLGKREEAIQLLQNQFEHRKALSGLLSNPDLDALKTDPRYRQLIAKINTSKIAAP